MAKDQTAIVLVIGGLDPGGGAGVLADARAVTAAGAFACAVVALQTVQSTRGLVRAVPVDVKLWTEQARVVIAHERVRAIKTGALGSTSNVRAMIDLARDHRRIPLVVDPVMLPTRGASRLLDARAIGAMRELVALSTLVTANADEAAALTNLRVTHASDARVAARALVALGARAALVKGGHLNDARAIDVLATRDRIVELSTARLRFRRPVHGTGCALASLIAAHLARGKNVRDAVRAAKRAHHASLASALSSSVGSMHAR